MCSLLSFWYDWNYTMQMMLGFMIISENILLFYEQFNYSLHTYFVFPSHIFMLQFSTPFGSTILRFGSFCHLQMAIVQILNLLIYHKGREVNIIYFILSIPLGSTYNNSKKNNWILMSRQYAHLQMTMRHCTESFRRKIWAPAISHTPSSFDPPYFRKITGSSQSDYMNINKWQ
jgi:hypothetical protein